MRRHYATVVAACVLLIIGGCSTAPEAAPLPTETTPPTTDAPIAGSHESAPEAPIVFGITVPVGAVQLGPTVRQRSELLLDAYKPELDAAIAQAAAEEEVEELQVEPTEDVEVEEEPTPTATPIDSRPERDTFALLEEPPRADTITSYMRIDGDPTDVVNNLLAQLSTLLPEAEIVYDDLSQYCVAEERRIVNCALDVEGTTPAGRELRVTLNVDPGNFTTRTGNAASDTRPVMVLRVEHVGDPRLGQANDLAESLESTPDLNEFPDKSDLIWPAMDEDESVESDLVAGWAPTDGIALPLLTGNDPEFAIVYTSLRSQGEDVTTEYLHHAAPERPVSRDVLAELTEVHKSHIVTTANGDIVTATHVVSARGNYLFLTTEPGE